MTRDEIDSLIREAWRTGMPKKPEWHTPTVFIGEWVRVAYLAGRASAAPQPLVHRFTFRTDNVSAAHETLRIWVNGALAGRLTLRTDEAAELKRALSATFDLEVREEEGSNE